MKWFKSKGLSKSEIDRAILKIREEYNDYIVRFYKSPEYKEQFEDRYYYALKNRLNIENFIAQEYITIKELVENEQIKINKESEEKEKKSLPLKPEKKPEPGFADKILEEFQERIKDYPSIDIHENALEEVEKLYGFIANFERNIWPDLDTLLRRYFSSQNNISRNLLENQLWELSSGSTRIPSVLNRYYSSLISSTVSLSSIAAEARACILKASFFIHDALKVTQELLGANLVEKDRSSAIKIQKILEKALYDFRLKDMNLRDLH